MRWLFQNLIVIAFNLILGQCLRQNDESLLPKPDWFLNEIFEEFAGGIDNSISLKKIQHLIDDLSATSTSAHTHHRNILRSDFHRCYSAEELFSIFEFNKPISKTNFTQISPSLLWLTIENLCNQNDTNRDNNSTDTSCTSSPEQRYLYGSLTIIITWISALIFLFTTSRFNKYKKYIILTLNALAVGTLLGDGLLHMIPHAIGLHNHGEESHDHHGHDDHGHEDGGHDKNEEQIIVWKLFTVLSTIFVLMFLSFFGGHGHSHGDDNHDHSHNSVTPVENGDHTKKHNDYEIPAHVYNKASESVKTSQIIDYNTIPKTVQKKPKKLADLLHGTSLVIILANLIHKCADGLAIGAAFSGSLTLGFSTGLALLFHEIPHELGDYGMLSSHGFKYWQIMIISSIGSFLSLCALLIITAINPESAVREWILAITAGVFIYIALVAMTPTLKSAFTEKKKNGKRDWIAIILALIGFWIGVTFMLLIALFEDDIKIDASALCQT